jgi:DNA-binding response OmpR family regulator
LSPASPRALRVLIVDDDTDLLNVLEEALRRGGLVPVIHNTFERGRDALHAAPFDALLTDIRLGPFNGLQLAIEARELQPGIRIVVFSGFDDPVLRAQAEDIGATFVTKPALPSMLLRELTSSGGAGE